MPGPLRWTDRCRHPEGDALRLLGDDGPSPVRPRALRRAVPALSALALLAAGCATEDGDVSGAGPTPTVPLESPLQAMLLDPEDLLPGWFLEDMPPVPDAAASPASDVPRLDGACSDASAALQTMPPAPVPADAYASRLLMTGGGALPMTNTVVQLEDEAAADALIEQVAALPSRCARFEEEMSFGGPVTMRGVAGGDGLGDGSAVVSVSQDLRPARCAPHVPDERFFAYTRLGSAVLVLEGYAPVADVLTLVARNVERARAGERGAAHPPEPPQGGWLEVCEADLG
ncbi:hypothetical protein [Motilibacter deserti]|uniref:PknH-like protein n=1 Tax=Motilibacter deserti TaxID=2714956 RepID=A0ABX0GXH6_9ACTN|nr:hypothetical protein [Motilibacter deserti]NHC14811.1 hypothetical protein [Motilibacter deserti]